MDSPRSSEEFRQSWRILGVGIVGLPLCLMPTSAIGVFINPLTNAFGWSWASVSGVALFMGLGTVLAGPIEGKLIDQFGSRRVILICVWLMALAVAATSFIRPAIWTLYLVMFLWACVGSGFVTNYVRAIRGSFDKGGGTATGLMFLAGGVGCAIGPRLAQWTIDQHGWRAGYLALGACVLLAWPLAFFWLPERKATGTDTSRHPAPAEEGYTRRQALGTGAFRYIGGAWLLSGLAGGGYFFLAPFLSKVGLSSGEAASCLSIMFAASAVVHPVLGYINDRWHPLYVAALAFLLKAVAFAMLGIFGAQFVVTAAILAGVAMSGLSNSLYISLPRYFGLRSFGELAGWILSAASAAGMLGPLLFSLIQGETGSYLVPYLSAGLIAICSALCMAMAGRCVAGGQLLPHRSL